MGEREYVAARRRDDPGACLCGRYDRHHACAWEVFGIEPLFAMMLGTMGTMLLLLAGICVWALVR